LAPWSGRGTRRPWRVDQAERSDVPELHGFAIGLRRDWPAVEAAVCLPWSNGQTEGQITKLKLLKRSTYGVAALSCSRDGWCWPPD
jgi:transposase